MDDEYGPLSRALIRLDEHIAELEGRQGDNEALRTARSDRTVIMGLLAERDPRLENDGYVGPAIAQDGYVSPASAHWSRDSAYDTYVMECRVLVGGATSSPRPGHESDAHERQVQQRVG